MVITGKVVSKSITGNGVFARVRLDCNGWPKAAMMRFFDVPDQENWQIGETVKIDIRSHVWEGTLVPRSTSPEPASFSETLQADLEPLPVSSISPIAQEVFEGLLHGRSVAGLHISYEDRKALELDSRFPVLTPNQVNLLDNLTEPLQRPEWCTEIGVAPVVVDETGDARFDVENIPLPEPTPENMTERSDSQGLGDRR